MTEQGLGEKRRFRRGFTRDRERLTVEREKSGEEWRRTRVFGLRN